MQAIVPSLLSVVDAAQPQWRHCVEIVAEATKTLSGPIALAGHSGGGLLLPAIAAEVEPEVSHLLFVDSGVPAEGAPLAAPEFRAQLESLAVDGVLPPWSAWWGDDAMRELVPDEATRIALIGEMPALPLSYFEQTIPSPPDWERTACGYLLLSEGYAEAASAARDRGWPVEEIRGAHHLQAVVDPVAVTDALLRLVR